MQESFATAAVSESGSGRPGEHPQNIELRCCLFEKIFTRHEWKTAGYSGDSHQWVCPDSDVTGRVPSQKSLVRAYTRSGTVVERRKVALVQLSNNTVVNVNRMELMHFGDSVGN
ncbi:hypothetical protein KIPB_006517 [Kipferlia bialata]|uniref:Uncharacterized protein n=1 Tax=Kipferlia bialata TaxID=797122 RepID=A0A9K3CXN4_9EUKA|nr:hypothetical protein KIPB_006517 [Kipferlia bialata]|eukprot:g6517.t1